MGDAMKPAEPDAGKPPALGIRRLRGFDISKYLGKLLAVFGVKQPDKKKLNLAIIAIVVIAVAVIALFFYINMQVAALLRPAGTTKMGSISGSMKLISDGMLTYNHSAYIAGYARLHYSEANAINASLSLAVYPSNPVEPIYLVNVGGYCFQCFIGSSLFEAMNSSMRQMGLVFNSTSLNYIDINELASIPNNSIVIIPSGLMPNILLPNVGYTEGCQAYSDTTILTLLSRGDTVIYVGRDFSRSVTCSGQVAQDTAGEISDLPATNTTATNFTKGELYFSSPTFSFFGGSMFGAAQAEGVLNGTLVVLSNYPSVGWNNNVGLLASDISKVVESRFWIAPLASGVASPALEQSDNVTIFTMDNMMRYRTDASTTVNESYALLTMKLYNNNGMQEYELPFRYTMKQNGIISMAAVVGAGQQSEMNVSIFNSSGGNIVNTYAKIYNQSLVVEDNATVHIGQTGSTPLYKDASFGLPSEYYIASLTDQGGSAYSSALFFLENATITQGRWDFKNSTFSFFITSNNATVSGARYTIGINGAYNYTGTVQDGVMNYSLPHGTSTPSGNRSFDIFMFGSKYVVPYQYQTGTSINIPPLYIAFALAMIFIVVLNKVLVPPNIDEYYIDVPDIRPAKMEHAKEMPETILSVFDKVSMFYHWKNVPLSPDEIRTGIANNIKYGNTRMSITMRNTYAILNSLVLKKLVEMADDYYAPTKWIEESGHSIDYLVIYRKLRDFCIGNAMLITEMGAASKTDVIVTNKGFQNYIKIYSKDMTAKDMEIGQRARTFIVFLDEEARLSFLDDLYRTYGNNADILKMAIDYGNVRLVDSSKLNELKL